MSKLAHIGLLIALALAAGCGAKQKRLGQLPNESAKPSIEQRREPIPKKLRPPKWVVRMEFEGGELCGLGVAGAGFYENSPYPKTLSRKRAVENLAGILSTRIQEAIIDRYTTYRGQSVRTERLVTVDERLIEKVDGAAEVDYWRDVGGYGPFAQKNFTYAKACIDVHTAAELLQVSDSELAVAAAGSSRIDPSRVPEWIDRRGEQPGGRLCTVGFSMPTFHPDKTFEVVVEDVRVKLSTVIVALLSSYYVDLERDRNGQNLNYQEQMNVATQHAVANGVVVTDYWYDENGIGPFEKRRTTYGWGCIYPVEVLSASLEELEDNAPEEDKEVFRKVRERAQEAFADLDEEIEKREAKQTDSPAEPLPSREETPPSLEDNFDAPPALEEAPDSQPTAESF